MTFLSVAERVFCVRAYYEGGRSLKAARRAFAVRYSARRPPSAKTVWKVVRKFEAHGSVCDRRAGRSGRPPMAATPGEEGRGAPLLPGPRRAVAEAAEQLGVSLSSAYRLSRRLCEEGSGMLEREEELAPRESPERRSAPGQQRTEQQEQQEQQQQEASPLRGHLLGQLLSLLDSAARRGLGPTPGELGPSPRPPSPPPPPPGPAGAPRRPAPSARYRNGDLGLVPREAAARGAGLPRGGRPGHVATETAAGLSRGARAHVNACTHGRTQAVLHGNAA